MMAKLGIISILFFTQFAVAQSFYTTCTPPSASPTTAEVNAYNSCVANNRASAQSSGTAAAQSFTMSGTTVVLPGSATAEQTNIYNQNQLINNTTSTTALTAEQFEKITVTDTGAAGALAQIMQANAEGEATYLITAESTLAEGLGKLSLAGECASVSSSACYSQRNDLYAAGAGYLLAQRQAQDQVGQHQVARNDACIAKNQISTEQAVCNSAFDNALSSFAGAVNMTVSGITVLVTPGIASSPYSAISYDPLTGTCSPPTAPGCKNLSGKATPVSSQLQSSVRDILKQKYSGTKGVKLTSQNLYTTNADGSVSIKGSGNYSKNDFSDLSKLKSKGLTDSSAKNLMNSISSLFSNSASSTLGNESSKLAAKNSDEASATVTTVDINSASATNAATDFTGGDEFSDGDREPASLRIQVGEEFIGVAKDDIFKIINRRYKSEEKDDFFY